MTSNIWKYHIETPESKSSEEFAELFSYLEIEGIEELEDFIIVYISESYQEKFEQVLKGIISEYAVRYTQEILEDKNWNEEWEKNFQPISIGNLIHIRASFHPEVYPAKYNIIINPKMSFGTGHHATTRQMMEMMEKIDLKNKKVLDCGSGTGILSILAVLMQAKEVVAVDNDPWCYDNHLENNKLNHVETKVILGSIQDVGNKDFDIILANIQRNYILEHIENLSQRLKNCGQLMISGFWRQDNRDILDKALQYHLIAQYITEYENWSCILLKKNV